MADPTYITLPIEVDADTIAGDAIDYLKTNWEDWEPADGNLDAWLLNAFSLEAAQLRELASEVPSAIFRYYGDTLVNIPPVDAAPANGATTWTAKDNAGYTIPEGTQVGIRAAGDELIPFEVIQEVVIPPGSTATATGAVLIVATIPGADGTGLGSTGSAVELIDPLDWVTNITLTLATSGGVDAEEDDAYLVRLAQQLTLLTPAPILPSDFAILARTVAGVHRSTVLDGYNPADDTFNNPRMVTVSVIDEAGNACAVGIKNAVQSLLDSSREVTFIVNMMDPTYTNIDVTFTFKTVTGYDPATTEADAEAAVSNYLSPANWGRDPFAPNPTLDTTWVNVPTVRYLEIAQVINNVVGVDYITTLTMRYGANPFATTDINLPGRIPLPRAGVINGTGT